MLKDLSPLFRTTQTARGVGGLAVLTALVAIAIPISTAQAAQTFSFVSGSAQITATAGATLIVDENVPLTGAFVDFDDVLPEIVDFEITLGPTGTIAMVNPYGGFDMFEIDSASVVPGIGFTNYFISPTGPDQWNFLVGPVDVNAVYSASDSTLTNPPVMNQVAPIMGNPNLNGSIDSNLVTFELLGVSLMELPAGAFPGETENLLVKADITWSGILLPEPSTSLLLAIGLGGLALRGTRGRD